MWFADDGSYLRNETPSGTSTSDLTNLPSNAGYVNSIALDRSGGVWFASYFPGNFAQSPYGGGIGVIRPGASSATLVNLGANAEQIAPSSITLGPDGAIWFAYCGGVGRIDPATGAVQYAPISGVTITDMAFGSDGNLWFVDAAANDVGRITTSTIFPAGGGTSPSPGSGRSLAPALRIGVRRTSLRALAHHPVLTVVCRMAGAGRCRATLQVSAKVARGLGVTPPHHARTVTLARASRTFRRGGSARLALRLPATARRHLAGAHHLTLALTVTSSASGDRSRSVRRTIRLTRS